MFVSNSALHTMNDLKTMQLCILTTYAASVHSECLFIHLFIYFSTQMLYATFSNVTLELIVRLITTSL